VRSMKILIVGGVAGGASCATRARRLSEEAEIIIFERGAYVSFANCGLPYYVGDVISEERQLFMATPRFLKGRFNIDVRTENEVFAIDRKKNELEVKDLKTGKVYREKYDALVLAPGASPIRPPLPGIDTPGIFSLRTIPDSRQIREWITGHDVKQAVIVGGGFIGLEMAENLARRGVAVSIVEMEPQVVPMLDPEMAVPVQDHLLANGVRLYLGNAVSGFEKTNEGKILAKLESGETYTADLVLLSLGVRPEVELAKAAGLEIGTYGGIRVNDQMRTSDERILAVGDAVEVRDFITGEWAMVPLAGPANRQGRLAADVIFGRDAKFRGVQATAVCGVFGMTIASTGASEKRLRRAALSGQAIPYEKVYLHPTQHADYYPGAEPMALKLIFSPEDGHILGAQAVGKEGVEKRIDVIAMAIQRRSTVFDLEEAELGYSPQFGAAKDPVNLAGMVAANVLRGDAPIAHWEDVAESEALILDVRTAGEVALASVKGAVTIPLSELRSRMAELPRDREIWVFCDAGHRSYYATRTLRLNGFNARNISGGMRIYDAVKQIGKGGG
jgi:NADPH-dependent 2,4-dienoyl-CoA reductase/sulfur reductase-like enzyme/rhodanese-related sulfurtransferase